MFIPSNVIVQMPIKQAIRGKSGYDEANPGVVNPVFSLVVPFGLDLPLATKYGYAPPCPVQNIIVDFFPSFAIGKKAFMSSHFAYKSQFV